MYKFELEKTMECLGLKKEECYEIHGCKYYHSGKYYTIVKGYTPYELAWKISQKYDNRIYKIRVDGSGEDVIPYKDMGVGTYHIDTLEGLCVFLLETEDYYSHSNAYTNKMEEFFKRVYTKILQDTMPRNNNYDWMINRENSKDFLQTLLIRSTILDYRLRKRMDDFDNAINPFVNPSLDINSFSFAVSGYFYPNHNGFSLIDKKSGIELVTLREKDGFASYIRIPFDFPYEILVCHYFGSEGEKVFLEKYDDTGLNGIVYNLSTNLFGTDSGTKHVATVKDKKYIMQKLAEYTRVASEIVKKNVNQVEVYKRVKKK